jgi:hypothetical protein
MNLKRVDIKTITDIMNYITDYLHNNCPLVTKVIYSDNPEHITI